MNSTPTVLQEAIQQLTRGSIPFILLALGSLGSLGNFMTFTSRQLRRNSCAFYFLSTAMFELLTISFGLGSRIADQFGSTLQSTSRFYCKVRYYFALGFPTVASYLLLMTAVDRSMLTSPNVRCRAFSQLRTARRTVPCVITLCMVACSHTLFFVDHQPSCLVQPGAYSLFYSIFLIIFAGILPNALLLGFGLQTIRNIKKAWNRRTPTTVVSEQQQRRQKTEHQLIIVS